MVDLDREIQAQRNFYQQVCSRINDRMRDDGLVSIGDRKLVDIDGEIQSSRQFFNETYQTLKRLEGRFKKTEEN